MASWAQLEAGSCNIVQGKRLSDDGEVPLLGRRGNSSPLLSYWVQVSLLPKSTATSSILQIRRCVLSYSPVYFHHSLGDRSIAIVIFHIFAIAETSFPAVIPCIQKSVRQKHSHVLVDPADRESDQYSTAMV